MSRVTVSPASRAAAVGTPLHPDTLARFVDRLPIPHVRRPDGVRTHPTDPNRKVPYYRIAMREARVRVHRDVPPTRMWTYDGTMPGATLEVRGGVGAFIEWSNELPSRHFLPIDPTLHGAGKDRPEVRTVVHVHGAKAPPASDGYPEDWFLPGRSITAHYPTEQDAATLWYHDHAMGLERLNQYAGLLGGFIVRDDFEDALGLPSGAYEIPLFLCDRWFDANGQLRYPTSGNAEAPWVSEVYGDASLVNGKLYPYVEVQPRLYRFRAINASNTRTYTLSFASGDSPPPPLALHAIGSDQGLLRAPVALSQITIAPAERADFLVDFGPAAGRKLLMLNQAAPLMQVMVAPGARPTAYSIPSTLRDVARIDPASAVKTRMLTLDEYNDAAAGRMLMLLDGKYWHDPISEKPVLGTTEIWSLLNVSEDAHPIHLHLIRFQILDRRLFDADEYRTSKRLRWMGEPIPPAAHEAGWKDTVVAAPGMATRIIARFDGYTGRYVWHCHVLEHAANEMMRPFEVIAS